MYEIITYSVFNGYKTGLIKIAFSVVFVTCNNGLLPFVYSEDYVYIMNVSENNFFYRKSSQNSSHP